MTAVGPPPWATRILRGFMVGTRAARLVADGRSKDRTRVHEQTLKNLDGALSGRRGSIGCMAHDLRLGYPAGRAL
jgi:hypothetical protein